MDFRLHNVRSQIPIAISLLRHSNVAPPILAAIQKKYRLTPTQVRVAVLLAVRLTNDEIAFELSVKPSTARRHTEAVLLRLDVNSRFKVVARLAELFHEEQP
ncbi:MAG TPA: LuxR C-terminal-related transcriptional regulator [Pyrinomonadaceae bacterium]|nr:LuxR C-terminal-related transcriptional regulator [Pyrinomonadaceae bacterium]